MLMSGFARHVDSWLAIARHEKIDTLEKLIGYTVIYRAGHYRNYIHLTFPYIDLFVASNSEPAINVSGEAGH